MLSLIPAASTFPQQWNRYRHDEVDIRRRANLARHADHQASQVRHAAMFQGKHRGASWTAVDKA